MDTLLFFNQEDIERLFFIGFQDAEGLELQAQLAQLGELYVNDEGQIVERKPEDAEAAAEPEAVAPEPEPVEEVVEQAVFADV